MRAQQIFTKTREWRSKSGYAYLKVNGVIYKLQLEVGRLCITLSPSKRDLSVAAVRRSMRGGK